MASLGLLGALGGLGQGLQSYGNALFNEELERRRQERLSAIEDRKYARRRQDTLADYQMARTDAEADYQRNRTDAESDYQRNRTDQLADVDSQRGFQKGLISEERAYNAGQLKQIVQGDNGELVGIKQDGTRMELGTISVDDKVSDYLRSFNSISAYLQTQGATPDDPTFAADFNLRNSLMQSIAQRIGTDNEAIIAEAMADNPGKSREAVENELRIKGVIF